MYFWRLEIQDQSVSRLDFSLSLLYTLHTVAFLLNPQRTHGILPWCLFMCLVSLSYETQASLDYDPSRKPYFKLIPSLKASFQMPSHSKLLKVVIQHMNWAGRHSSVCNNYMRGPSLLPKPPALITRLSNIIWVWTISVFLPFNCNSCLFVSACIYLGDS